MHVVRAEARCGGRRGLPCNGLGFFREVGVDVFGKYFGVRVPCQGVSGSPRVWAVITPIDVQLGAQGLERGLAAGESTVQLVRRRSNEPVLPLPRLLCLA